MHLKDFNRIAYLAFFLVGGLCAQNECEETFLREAFSEYLFPGRDSFDYFDFPGGDVLEKELDCFLVGFRTDDAQRLLAVLPDSESRECFSYAIASVLFVGGKVSIEQVGEFSGCLQAIGGPFTLKELHECENAKERAKRLWIRQFQEIADNPSSILDPFVFLNFSNLSAALSAADVDRNASIDLYAGLFGIAMWLSNNGISMDRLEAMFSGRPPFGRETKNKKRLNRALFNSSMRRINDFSIIMKSRLQENDIPRAEIDKMRVAISKIFEPRETEN